MLRKVNPDRGQINQRLMQVVRERSVTQADLVRMTGATSPTVSDWFNHGALPDADKLARFGKGTHTNLHWLLTGEGPEEEPGHGETLADRAIHLGRQEILGKIRRALDEIEAQVSVDVRRLSRGGRRPRVRR
jgi:hypothetical protein